MSPKVSFITAVKNRPEELKEMLESLIRQILSEWEAIIVDDHSTEPIQAVVESFNEPRFRFFHLPENLTGVANARNFAIERASSEIMITADGDDINWPARAEVTYDIMTKQKCDVFYGHVVTYFPSGDKRYDHPFQPFNAELFRMVNFITNPGTAFRKEIFLKVGGFDPEFILSEDYDLYLRMLNAGGKFCYSPLVLVEYRLGPRNLTVEKKELLHSFVQKVRIKNNLPPVDLNKVKKYALPLVADTILREERMWRDDRFVKKQNKN